MENIGMHGIITVHQLPEDWSDEELTYWWTPETMWHPKRGWVIVRPSRLSNAQKDAMRVPIGLHGELQVENLITNAGISNLLTNLSVGGQGSMQPFAQILSVGNGATTGVTRADTSVVGDGFGTNCRKVAATFSVVGFQSTITFNYASGDANGTLTNLGLYGGGSATVTTGTGTLYTHSLFSFVKGATPQAINYVLLLSN